MTKLEEMARALWLVCGCPGTFDGGNENGKRQFLRMARAAIEALRGDKRKKETELPDHIWRAGVAAREAEGDQGSVVNIWEAMIDAVLSEEG